MIAGSCSGWPACGDLARMTELHRMLVVGGGIAGLAAAWDLRNRDVVVLEASAPRRRPHPVRGAG